MTERSNVTETTMPGGGDRSGPRDPAPDTRAILSGVRRILRAADLASRHLARATGLTAPQLAVLQAVSDLGEVTTGRISADARLSQGTVTIILDRLVERGLVMRYRSPADRRIVHSRLTQTGSTALAIAAPLLNERLIRAHAALPAEEAASVMRALGWVAATLETYAGSLEADCPKRNADGA